MERKSLLDRALSLTTRVEPGEGIGALLLASNVFLLLGAYYVLKTVRESLILSEASPEVKSYAAAGQVLLFVIFLPVYGWFGSRVGRVQLVCGSTIFFLLNLLGFAALGTGGARIGIAFYLWLGVFNMFVVAQFWGFANDIYTEEQGKRLFPAIGVGASLGAWVGSVAAGRYFKAFGPYQLMMLAAVILGACAALSLAAHVREKGRAGAERAREAEQPLDKKGGFGLVLRTPYLLWIALLVLLLNLVNTTGEYLLGKLVVQTAIEHVGAGEALEKARGAFIGEFYGDFFSWVNLVGFLTQTFLVSRIFAWIGVRTALFVLPAIAMTGYIFLLALPLLKVIRISKILENAMDYSLNNTARHALFLKTSREAKYKAKAAIDTFFVRTGDLLQAGLVFAGTQIGLSLQGFAGIVLAFVAIWFLVVWKIRKEEPAAE